MEGVLGENVAYNRVPSSSNDFNRGSMRVAHKGTI